MKKLLFITSVDGLWPFVQSLSFNLKEHEYDVDLLDYEEHTLVNFNKCMLIDKINIIKYRKIFRWKLYHLWKKYVAWKYKKFLSKLSNKYDVTLILYHDAKLNKLTKEITNTSKKLIIAYAGSDYYNVDDKIRIDNKKLISKAKYLVFGNPYMAENFVNYYKDYNSKIFIASVGLHNLDLIKKIKKTEAIDQTKAILGVPDNKIIISIGYTGDKRHRQLDFVEMIGQNFTNEIKKKIFLLVPMTYIKTEKYIKEIKNKAEHYNIKYKIFDEILSDSDVCRLRICTDIAVHIATMDQSSGSMLEHLFSQNVVIAGNWLPYKFWDDLRLYSYRVTENEILEKVLLTINNLKEEKEKFKRNSQIIYDNYSWQKRINNWISVLS